MASFFADARCVVPVKAKLPSWDGMRWQRQLKAWRADSKAIIIPYPHNWLAACAVQEVWIFSDSFGPQHYNHVKRDYAQQKISQDLERFQQEAAASDIAAEPQQQGEASAARDAPEKWAKYQDPNWC